VGNSANSRLTRPTGGAARVATDDQSSAAGVQLRGPPRTSLLKGQASPKREEVEAPPLKRSAHRSLNSRPIECHSAPGASDDTGRDRPREGRLV